MDSAGSRRKTSFFEVGKNGLYAVFFWAILASVLPLVALAECPPSDNPNAYPNPICANTFLELIQSVAEAARTIAVPFAVIAIIIVGFRFVAAAAGGKTEEVAKARKLFLWVLVGSAIIVGSTILVEAVINTIKTL